MMKHKLLKKSGFFYLLVILLLPCLAHATVVGTVDITHTGYYANDSIMIWGGGYDGLQVYAGVTRFKKTGGTNEGKLWSNGSLGAFCIELAEPHPTLTTTYDVIMPADGPRPTTLLGSVMGDTKAQYLQELWGRYYEPSWATGSTFTSTQNSQAAAFSAAIWEIVHEQFTGNPLTWDVTVDGTPGNGGFAAYGVDSTLANKWLHSLDGTGPMADLRVFSYDGVQDFLVAVPEPATIALLGIGSAFSLIRRKKKV
jgi:hypothetical protein